MCQYGKKALQNIERLAKMSEVEFYEKYVANATLEEQAEFMKEFPEFLSKGLQKDKDELENDGIYQAILSSIGG